ncbi:hypothetical protein GUJ93_ZPchr0014g47420 [Zizania palustris]|uniref:Uncharacterized protein n=1 Tax=Zizania palustris TaxID=103762 RepID=A0A8J5W0P5_ZIZPA|nr:hypothetical protein GUJ93_ZPchr0014g47420 [Zizania palustris]
MELASYGRGGGQRKGEDNSIWNIQHRCKNGVPCDSATTSVKGMQAYIPQTTFAPGCKDVPCNSTHGYGEAIEVAKRADTAVLIAGLSLTEETEDHNRVTE